MQKKIAGISLAIGLILGLTLTSILHIQSNGYTEEPKISKEAIDILSKAGEAMAEIVSAVRPTVVNISSTKKIKLKRIEKPFFFDDPFFRRFFGDEFFHQFRERREEKTTSLGSGVIVDKAGYILTNYHVIKNADEIKVTLSDKREFIGIVKGVDPKTDLGLIKIDADNLPILRWGDSDKLRIGETVIAVGSPYGLSQTVTSGIVSAKGRANIGIADYEDFIQTDAAINPGNSGGALVNIRGELVGINTAIFSTSGGYQGIGFAIPSNMAKAVLESLIKKGKVTRGWIGVRVQTVTKEIAKEFGLKEEYGALVIEVSEKSPAEKAGIKRYDVIIEYNGMKIDEPTTLRNAVSLTPLGKEVELKLIREGKEQTIKLVVGEQPEAGEILTTEAYENLLKGLQVESLTPELRTRFNIPSKLTGVIVSGLKEDAPSKGYLRIGDVIEEINRIKIQDVNDYEKLVSRLKPDEDVTLLLWRDGRPSLVILSP